MTFARMEMLFLIWAAPLALLVFLYGRGKRKGILKRYAAGKAMESINPDPSSGRRQIKAGLVITTLLFMAFALSGLQYGYSWQEVRQKGVSIILAVDCSRSMLAADIKPDRLERAKREIHDLLGMLKGDKIGLAAFSGTSFLQCPLTVDYGAFSLFLTALSPDYLPIGGTDIAGAIETALNAFDEKDNTEKAIILITDGESTTGNPISAAKKAAEKGVRIFCIGMGAEEGAPIPGDDGSFKKDSSGNIIMSRLDEELLQKISALTGGAYVRSVTGDMDLETIYLKEIKGKMEDQTLEAGRKKLYIDRYQWLLAPAIAALVADLLISSAKRIVLTIIFVFMLTPWQTALAAGSRDKIEAGEESYQAEQYDKALKSFLDAQIEDPENKELIYNIGNAYYRLEDFEAARNHYKMASEAEDKALKSKALYNLGNASFRMGDLPGAIENYTRALKIDPEDKDAEKNLEFVKKMLEQQKQQSQQNKDNKQKESEKKESQDKGEKSGDNKNQEDKKSEDDSEKEQKSSEQNEQQENSGGSKDEQEQKDEPSPDYADSMEQDKKKNESQTPQTGQEEEPQSGESGQAGTTGADESMLNRLKDKPGRAMVPRYRKRNVEKDW